MPDGEKLQKAIMKAALVEHQLNTRVGGWTCGAVTAQVENRHQFNNQVEKKSMKCTRMRGHEGLHSDGGCCWRKHEFADFEVVGWQPRDARQCICGKRYLECRTARRVQEYLLAEMISEGKIGGRDVE